MSDFETENHIVYKNVKKDLELIIVVSHKLHPTSENCFMQTN